MANNPQRKVIVLASLIGVLTLTSALLLALAPPPLGGQGGYDNLWASENSPADAGSDLSAALFQTHVPAHRGEWKFIFIHDSGPNSAGAANGDHFVVPDPADGSDGRIVMTQRWNNQKAASPAGVVSIDPACISICVDGNFDHAAPSAAQMSAAQMRRLAQLVSTLQGQLGIGGDQVFAYTAAAPGSGVGREFPVDDLKQQILP
jgi:hypothetical protein